MSWGSMLRLEAGLSKLLARTLELKERGHRSQLCGRCTLSERSAYIENGGPIGREWLASQPGHRVVRGESGKRLR